MPAWVATAFADYSKRFPADWPFTLKEIKPEACDSAAQTKSKEAEKIRAALPKDACLIVLDERGKDLTTQALAAQLERWQADSRHLVLVIGGADGLDDSIKQLAHFTLRLSSLTLPHMFARLLLIEQLYRAWSILNHHPYHRI